MTLDLIVGLMLAGVFCFIAFWAALRLIFPKRATYDDDHTYGDTTGWK